MHAGPGTVPEPRIVELRQELPLLDIVPVRRAVLVDRVVVDLAIGSPRAHVGVVADQEHDRTVGGAADRVRTVIAHPGGVVPLDPLDPIHHVVAVRVFELVEAWNAANRSLILTATAAASGS